MGWSGSAMVLGKLPVPGRPAGLGSGGALFAVGAGPFWGLFGFFFAPVYYFSSFFLSGRRLDID